MWGLDPKYRGKVEQRMGVSDRKTWGTEGNGGLKGNVKPKKARNPPNPTEFRNHFTLLPLSPKPAIFCFSSISAEVSNTGVRWRTRSFSSGMWTSDLEDSLNAPRSWKACAMSGGERREQETSKWGSWIGWGWYSYNPPSKNQRLKPWLA